MYLIINNKKIEVKKCTNFFSRLKGFMFTKRKIEHALWFPNCSSIHTFFMYQNISLIFTDKQLNVTAYYPNVEKNKVIFSPKKTYHTFELPPYFIEYLEKVSKIEIKK